MSIEQIETGRFSYTPTTDASLEKLRIVSWNIARGCHLDSVTEFLTDANPDLVLLQEVDRSCVRSGLRNVASELSRKLRMHYVFGTEFHELAQANGSSPAHHGQATLCRWELRSPRLLRFSRQSDFWRPRLWMPTLPVLQRRLGGRIAVVTELALGTVNLVVYNLHLESRNGVNLRLAQLGEVLADANRYSREVPMLIGGDFNFDVTTYAGSAALREAGFAIPFSDARPTTAPGLLGAGKSLDSIICRGRLETIESEIHSDVRASDHFPLSLTIRFQ